MRILFQEKAATWHQSSPGVEQPYAPQDQKAAGRYDFQQRGVVHEVGRIPRSAWRWHWEILPQAKKDSKLFELLRLPEA